MTTLVNLTGNLADLIGSDFDARRTKVWIEANVDRIFDLDNNVVRLGPATPDGGKINDDGTFTFTGLIATNSTGINPTAFQYRLWVDYAKAGGDRSRAKESFGWWDITANSDVTDLVGAQYVPPTFMSDAQATLQGYVDQGKALHDDQVAISGLTGEDTAVAYLVNNPSSSTGTALTGAYVPKWKPSTAYSVGDIRMAPDGSIVERTVAGTSGTTYSGTNWKTATGLAGQIDARAVAKDSLFINVKDHGAKGDGTTDDTAAIQSAITAANWPATRATVFFPPGEYLITSAISINGGGATSTPQLDILGYGARLKTSTAGINMLDITNSVISLTRVRVRGLQMLVNAASTGIRLNNAEFCVLSEIDFLGSFGLAVKIEGTSTYNTIKDCTFSNLSRGIHIPGSANYLSIIGCHFGEQTAGSPLNWIQAETVQSVGVKVVGCSFYGEGNTLPALNIVQGYTWTIEGCHFAYCSDVALFIGSDGASYSHTVVGCTFDHNGKDDIKVNGGRLNSIVGCTFGIRKSGAAASTYCNVTILNTFGGAAGSDNSVIGCTSKDTGTALAASFSAAAACSNVAFIANHYSIAASNANTSGAIFGRDGVQVPTGKTITKDGISFPTVLARVTGIDAKTVAATTLYTVPTGKTAVITGAIVQSGAVSAITAGPTLGIGIAAGEDDIYASTALTGLTSNAKTYVFPNPGLEASAPAGSVIKVGIDTASTGTSQTVHVSLIGFLL